MSEASSEETDQSPHTQRSLEAQETEGEYLRDDPDKGSSSQRSEGPREEPRYTRDELVAAFTDFYTFLTKLHIDPKLLELPPPGGWPGITPESCAGLGKTDFVIDLLRHLPYINGLDDETESRIAYKSDVLGYCWCEPEAFSSDFIKAGETTYSFTDDPVPPHVIVIAVGHESSGRDILLDTLEGEIIEEAARMDRVYHGDAMEWFEGTKEEFRSLNTIPVLGWDMIKAGGWEDMDREITEEEALAQKGKCFETKLDVNYIRQIFRKYGWPNGEFKKKEAFEEFHRFKEKREERNED